MSFCFNSASGNVTPGWVSIRKINLILHCTSAEGESTSFRNGRMNLIPQWVSKRRINLIPHWVSIRGINLISHWVSIRKSISFRIGSA